jgi:hypothetical protein
VRLDFRTYCMMLCLLVKMLVFSTFNFCLDDQLAAINPNNSQFPTLSAIHFESADIDGNPYN